MIGYCYYVFFFFKQKTAYEVRISDWSSDVCSSDLHAPAAIPLASPNAYVDALRDAHVWADVASRKAEIRHQIEKQAATLRGHARITEDLLDEVTALVEWPVAITGHFEQQIGRASGRERVG